MREFTAHVALVNPATRKVEAFAPGDEVPSWAEVGDHVAKGEPAKRGPGRPRKDEPKTHTGDARAEDAPTEK